MANRKKNKARIRQDRENHSRRWHDDLEPETKKSILAIVFFALALITVLAYWGRAGFFGNYIFKTLELAVGKAYFLAPATFVLIGFSLLFSFRRHLFAATFIGAGIFLASGLALIQLFFKDMNGGWIGFAVNWPLERTFGPVTCSMIRTS